MSKIWFFTNESSIVSAQIPDDAFGNLQDDQNQERYNLENKFSLATDAPIYAITKSFVLAIQDSTNPDLVNLVLSPINSYTCGMPVKLFVYRGVKKDSLIDTQGNIKQADSSWKSDNILKVIKDLQNLINSKRGTNDIAKSDTLGYQFSTLPDDTLIENLIFDETDNFHAIIVEAGCQVGKFSGGAIKGGVEVILDRIGYETKLGPIKKSDHIFRIDKLVLASGLTEKEKLKQKFIHRFNKEEILNYVDITAFYGAAKNQKIKIKEASDNDNFLAPFFNKNKVYIDVRDDRGFSFNHFFKFNDKINVGFYSSDSSVTNPVFSEHDYYLKWPILVLDNQLYNNNKKYFFIKIPIHLGTPINSNIISSYTGRISTEKDKTKKHHFLVSEEMGNGNIGIKETEAIKLENWRYDDNKLGANYFLLKKSTLSQNEFTSNVNDMLLNNVFSLKMNPLFDFNNLQEGEFIVNTYSSLNSPVLAEENGKGYFLPTVGIAMDSNNVTFFYFKEQSVFSNMKQAWSNQTALINKGKYKLKFESQEYEYSNSNQKVGFLDQLLVHLGISSMKLTKYSFNDTEQNIDSFRFVTYAKNDEENDESKLYGLKSITLTLQEYLALKNHVSSSNEFLNHPGYLVQKNTSIIEYGSNKFSETEISVSNVIINESEDNPPIVSLDLVPVEEEILLDNEPISLTAFI